MGLPYKEIMDNTNENGKMIGRELCKSWGWDEAQIDATLDFETSSGYPGTLTFRAQSV